ncbi:MAG: Na-translocating system protein MpsC family protein, partial [bacterium]
MDKTESSVTVIIRKIVANFLEEQLGEKAKSITTFQFRNKIVVYAEGCFTPAEDDLVNNEEHSNLLQELKYREFEQVKPLLKDRLEKALGL